MFFENPLVFGYVWFVPTGKVECIIEHVAVSQCSLLNQALQILSVGQTNPKKTGTLHDGEGS